MNLILFGENIRSKRFKLKMSQTELANEIGISRNYLSTIERGLAKNPSWKIINVLSIFLEKKPIQTTSEKNFVEGLEELVKVVGKYWVNIPDIDNYLHNLRYGKDKDACQICSAQEE